MKLCNCGCEKEVRLSHHKYITGHNIVKGKKWSKESILKRAAARKINTKLKKLGLFEGSFPFCKCGCGKRVNHIKNEYLKGHNNELKLGSKHSEQTKTMMSKTLSSAKYQKRQDDIMMQRYGVRHSFQVKQFIDAAHKTYFERTGYTNPSYDPILIERANLTRRITNEKNGIWMPRSILPNWELYRRLVYYYTNISAKKKYTKEELSKRKLAGVDDGVHLDHKYSTREGFRNNILPCIIGNVCNIELVPWRINSVKLERCSITKEELFKLYEKEIKE